MPEVTERIITKLGHIVTYDCYLKNLVRTPPGILPLTGWVGQKTLFWDGLWTLTEHISAAEQDINHQKKTCQSTGTFLHAPKFSELWSSNGWERLASFCPPPKFSHWETLQALQHGRYITDSRQLWHVLCSGTRLQSRITECRACSRWASSCI